MCDTHTHHTLNTRDIAASGSGVWRQNTNSCINIKCMCSVCIAERMSCIPEVPAMQTLHMHLMLMQLLVFCRQTPEPDAAISRVFSVW